MPTTNPIEQTREPIRRRNKATLPLAAAAILALGGAAGAAMMAQTRPSVTMAPATPVAIRSLTSGGIVTIAGRVAEIYGDKFVIADASGRALVETGRDGEDGRLVTAGEPVTVQGRFDHGFLHAAFLVGPDKKVTALGPLDRPPHGHGPHGPDGGPHGPDSGTRGSDGGSHGPDGGPDAPFAPDARRAPVQGMAPTVSPSTAIAPVAAPAGAVTR